MPCLECEMEAEVLAAIAESRWPGASGADLRAHAAQCPLCADLAAVAAAFQEEHQHQRSAPLPDAGRVWWKAQLRARREAAEAAGRPITVAQLIAFGCSVGLLGACFGATSEWFQATLQWFRATVPSVLTQHLTIAIAVLAACLLIPAAMYLTASRD